MDGALPAGAAAPACRRAGRTDLAKGRGGCRTPFRGVVCHDVEVAKLRLVDSLPTEEAFALNMWLAGCWQIGGGVFAWYQHDFI